MFLSALAMVSAPAAMTGSGISGAQVVQAAESTGQEISSPRVSYCADVEYVEFGNFYQEDTNGDGKADENDEKTPVRWRILEKDGDELLLVSDKVLYYAAEHGSDSKWKNSSMRQIMNSSFITTAFNSEEQGALVECELSDSTSSDPEDTTRDKVFALSFDEAKRYMPDDELLMAQCTDYFRTQFRNFSFVGGEMTGSLPGYYYAGYRLRTAGDKQWSNRIDCTGDVANASKPWDGVRPAIRINTAMLSAPLSVTSEKVGIDTVEYDQITFGNYNGKPITWRVLSVEGTDAMVISEDIVDQKAYVDSPRKLSAEEALLYAWYNCSLRKWLNEDFYEAAFSTEEQAAIKTTHVKNENEEIYNYTGLWEKADKGQDTEDKIYLLSYKDSINNQYGFSQCEKKTDTARNVGTDYYMMTSQAGNVYNVKSSPYSGQIWGSVIGSNGTTLDCTAVLGVRPVMHVDLSKLTYTKEPVWGNHYQIYSISDKNVKVDAPGAYYNGSAYCPEVTVTVNDVVLKEGVDYTLTYENTTEVGTGAVVITGTGTYNSDGIKYVGTGKCDIYIYEPYEKSTSDDIFTTDIEVTYGQTEARSMLERINQLRTGSDAWYWSEDDSQKLPISGLKGLSYDYQLEKVAMARAAELAVAYGHLRPNGESCQTAYAENAYLASGYGENIAFGYTSEEAVFRGWAEENQNYENQGHRRNMLSRTFKSVGIGHVKYQGVDFWVQEFSTYLCSGEETAAVDQNRTVSVDIRKDYVALSENAPKQISLKCGQTKSINNLGIRFVIKSTFNLNGSCSTRSYFTVPLEGYQVGLYTDGKVTAADCATSNQNGIVAKKPGTCDLVLTVQGKSYQIPIRVSHQTGVEKGGVAATCTTAGTSESLYCPGCNAVLQKGRYIPAKGHTVVTDKAVKATCNKSGKTEGSHCAVCKKVIKAQKVVKATGKHTYDSGKITKKPTLSKKGEKVFTCKVCKKTKKQTLAKLKKQTITVDKRVSKQVTLKKRDLMKKARTYHINAKAKTARSYKLTKGNRKYVTVSSKGKITVKKGAKAGIYEITVTAKETSTYGKATKKIKIVVK